jgi:hypothetical protein
MARNPVQTFLRLKAASLRARARQIIRLTPETVGLRPQDLPYAPSAAHFRAAHNLLRSIDRTIAKRFAVAARQPAPTYEDRLLSMAMIERDVDRARRAFGMFFELFAQRGTIYAPALAAHDTIGIDCYHAVMRGLPGIFTGPVLAPVCYLEHGYSPATVRRGISFARLLGDSLPFPVIRIPWDRDKPWQPVFLHEVAHNLQADLRIWEDVRNDVVRRLAENRFTRAAIATFGRWHKEIFADLAALLLGGPAAAFGMAEFMAHPSDKVMTFRPGAHPTGYLRIQIQVEMLRRMGFRDDADTLSTIWHTLYNPARGARMPAWLMNAAPRAIPAVVDEIAFQPRRNLAQKALASVIRFTPADQTAIRRGAFDLRHGKPPIGLPPRHIVSACRYALEAGAEPGPLGALVIRHLSSAPRTLTREWPPGATVPPHLSRPASLLGWPPGPAPASPFGSPVGSPFGFSPGTQSGSLPGPPPSRPPGPSFRPAIAGSRRRVPTAV